MAKDRARERASARQIEIKFLANVADFDALVGAGDISEDDLATPAPSRISAALAEVLPDLARDRAKHLEEQQREPATLYQVVLPGSRTTLGEATLADLEIAWNHLRDQVFDLIWQSRWFKLIAKALPTGKTAQEVLSLDQLRVMRHLSKPR
jgi:hypothetical protein